MKANEAIDVAALLAAEPKGMYMYFATYCSTNNTRVCVCVSLLLLSGISKFKNFITNKKVRVTEVLLFNLNACRM
jgi:hypothetical protein